ncbi:hypothetical protein [Hoeflea ulvae]|uniref:HTH luxR-type domain-containing protein n=1 Tax=Hoeflea ulvae TaxID=2983764 RepID=A0ABT3YKP5_9HYPH|nr:hypothetical protein [Hoeflea ulvae]MCY0096475.1 hypothetical protein [Hoeflea ulvae]
MEPLTSPERICLQLVARGRAHDIKALTSACRKLMASTTIEAVARALKLGLIH